MWKPINFSAHKKDALSSKLCLVPFNQFHIMTTGEVANCCYSWLPTSIGNIMDNTLLEMMENKVAKDIKQSMHDSSFSYCRDDLCPRIADIMYGERNIEQYPIIDKGNPQYDSWYEMSTVPEVSLYFDYDESCNLQCPSCRNELILHNGTKPSLIKIHEEVIRNVQILLDTGKRVQINVTGSGDPFASPLYWDFLSTFDGEKYPNLIIRLQTNGVLMDERHMEKLSRIYNRIGMIQVSVDAFTADTYNIVRKGGSFKKLQNNLRMLDEMAKDKIFSKDFFWMANFIVSKTNYSEINDFAKWILTHESICTIWYNMIADWEHLTKDEFNNLAVWQDTNSDHYKFLSLLTDPVLDNKKIDLGNMLKLREKAKHISHLFNK